ncbi:MAG: nucleotidyltransferase domain-containing protein [Armatimonadetes bacterium]|nr:nucleotidyltransferase domain-containing protein [Armatimonadota bacterium]
MTQPLTTARPDLPAAMQDLLDRLVTVIREHVDARLIVLFGSWAEGHAHRESDVDLVVVAPTTERLHLTIRLKRALRPDLGSRPLDLFVLTPQEWERARGRRGTLAWEADQFGVKLYERE